jgi:hypothetical protein
VVGAVHDELDPLGERAELTDDEPVANETMHALASVRVAANLQPIDAFRGSAFGAHCPIALSARGRNTYIAY